MISVGDVRFQDLLERYLRLRALEVSPADLGLHLDEDTLAALTDGNLSLREATPVVGHLADCSFCRHKTAELIRLDLTINGAEPSLTAAEQTEPSRVANVFEGIIQRLFGVGDAAVFAHEEKPVDEKAATDNDTIEK